MNGLSINQKLIISALVGFVIGAGAVIVWNISQESDMDADNADAMMNEEESMMEDNTTSSNMEDTLTASAGNTMQEKDTKPVVSSNGSNTVSVADQAAGMSVAVASVTFEKPSWVAIHEDVNGELGNVLGAAWYPAGVNTGVVELLRATIPGATYHAVLYSDDGDKEFELKGDPMIVDASKRAIMDTFMTASASN